MEQNAKDFIRQSLTKIGELAASGSVWCAADLCGAVVHF